MICKYCGHLADDHNFKGSMNPKYCSIDTCQCRGWQRDSDDKAWDFNYRPPPEPLNANGSWVRVYTTLPIDDEVLNYEWVWWED